MVAILGGTREFIFKAVEQMYTDVATQPGRTFHFPTGRLACLFVGYPGSLLDRIPATATESFAGVGYPFAANIVRKGDTVLDIGSGSGTDTLIASLLVGEHGIVRPRYDRGDALEVAPQRRADEGDERTRRGRQCRAFAIARRQRGRGDEQWRPQSRARQGRRLRRDCESPQAGRWVAGGGYRASCARL